MYVLRILIFLLTELRVQVSPYNSTFPDYVTDVTKISILHQGSVLPLASFLHRHLIYHYITKMLLVSTCSCQGFYLAVAV